ncbi:MAG: hypothetical protein EHM20_16465 [Alphaproteobacteria bacterium]|nr:MAG: hypothetical protein EHM20_16465 [Alphaproteobacteria bacterium]
MFQRGERMRKDTIRNSGINTIGSVNWGTHVCQLYHTKEDLMDILIPYLKAGLENNEFCIWITSNIQEAKKELRKSVSDLDLYMEKRQIEIILYNDWYLKTGFFDLKGTLNNWIEKLNEALTSGYDGLRLTEDIFSLENEYWDDFMEYEKEIDRVIGHYQIMALCTYSLNEYNATKTMDIIENHQFALIKKDGKWRKLKNSM